MPSKKRSGPMAPSRLSIQSNASRIDGTPARAEHQERNIQLSSNANAPENDELKNETLLGNASRLKRKRLTEPMDRLPKKSEDRADMGENVASLSAALQSVANRCEQLIQLIVKNHAIQRPNLDLIREIVFVLQKASAVKVLASVSNLPKILFLASQIGVEEDVESAFATSALVDALIHLAKIQTEDLPDFSSKKRRVRSAFVDNSYVDCTEVQIEAAKKAGEWALELLSSCIRGVSDAGDRSQRDHSKSQLRHADVSELFVLPRDKLDPILANLLIESSTLSLKRKTSVGDYPTDKPICSKLSDAQLRMVLCNPLCSSLLDQLLLNTEKAYTSSLKQSTAREPLSFISKVGEGVIQAGEQAFPSLSPLSQMILLRHSKNVWLWHRHTVELALLSSDKLLSTKVIRSICAPIANLIAYDVAVHWKLMDEVRNEICRKSEPFNTRSWRLRPFYRAVFSEALCLIRSETVSGAYEDLYRGSIVPLSKRFPTYLRSTARFLASADKCFALFTKTPEDASKTAISSLKILQRFLRGKHGTYRTSANSQAFLLCVESILQRMSWICAIEVVRAHSHSTKSKDEWKQITEDMAIVSCCIDVFRLPGGESAETDTTMNKRVRELKRFLLAAVSNDCFVLPARPERPRINSLLAFWLAGLICARGLNGFAQAAKFMDRFEVLEILRSLEIALSWGCSESSRERCKVVIRVLNRSILNK